MSRAPDQAVADLFFSLGDETRLSVVKKLRGGAALSATALSGDARVTRQAIAKHLGVLERAGLVSHEKRGREVLYVLELARLEEAQAFLEGISAGWDRAIGRLRRMVEAPPGRAPGQGRSRRAPERRNRRHQR
jgi:DNA-binding transcriptional ArsR family regulator